MCTKSKMGLCFTGQAGFIFCIGNTNIGIDLYLSDCVERYDGYKRLQPNVITPQELTLNALITTHWHYDHFDLDSVPLLLENGNTKLYAAYDCQKECEKLKINKKQMNYVKAGDTALIGKVSLEFVFCDHGDRAPDAIGVIVGANKRYIYITGDTSLRLDKIEEITNKRKMDLLILPINGAFGNLSESEAVSLCEAIDPKMVIPCHFGMFAEHHGDPDEFVNKLKKTLPKQHYYVMQPGEKIEL